MATKTDTVELKKAMSSKKETVVKDYASGTNVSEKDSNSTCIEKATNICKKIKFKWVC